LTAIVSSIFITTNTFQFNYKVSWEDYSGVPTAKPDFAFILTLSSSSLLDVAISSILLVYLSRAKTEVYSTRFHKKIKKLNRIIWEAAAPPAVCAIVTVIVYVTLSHIDYWDLMFQAILGKLYVMSLLVTLNGRAEMATEGASPGNDRLTSIAWVTSTPVRVDVVGGLHSSQTSSGTPSALENGMAETERSKTEAATIRSPNNEQLAV